MSMVVAKVDVVTTNECNSSYSTKFILHGVKLLQVVTT